MNLVDRIREIYDARHGRMEFTIERGQGETYSNDHWTLYAHDSYPRGSVLRGRQRRQWVEETEEGEGAETLMDACREAGVNVEVIVFTTFRHDSLADLPGEEL